MTNFERLIRPFQTGTIAPPRRPVEIAKSGTKTGPAQVALSGTPSGGDLLVINASSPAFGSIVVQHTLGGGETLTDAVLAMVAAVNAETTLTALGVVAAVVPTRPLEFTVTQPVDLNPQIVFTGSATGTTVMTVQSDNVEITAGKRGSVKNWSTSSNSTVKHYTHKYPKEVTFEYLNLEPLVLPSLPRIKFP